MHLSARNHNNKKEGGERQIVCSCCGILVFQWQAGQQRWRRRRRPTSNQGVRFNNMFLICFLLTNSFKGCSNCIRLANCWLWDLHVKYFCFQNRFSWYRLGNGKKKSPDWPTVTRAVEGSLLSLPTPLASSLSRKKCSLRRAERDPLVQLLNWLVLLLLLGFGTWSKRDTTDQY